MKSIKSFARNKLLVLITHNRLRQVIRLIDLLTEKSSRADFEVHINSNVVRLM